jgi:hypothetical protein
MAKIVNDKYYTSPDLAKYIVSKTNEIIGLENITEYIEPSAGAGVFLDYLDKPYLAYDIKPEDNRIVKQDWLTVDLEYKSGRCVIGNPPFGSRNTLIVKFFRKAIELSDYISFILPLSQLNNNYQLYQFDLIHSENLGIHNYSGVNLECCFNLFKRPKNGLNKKPNYKLKDIEIVECRRGGKSDVNVDDFDLGLCTYGSGIIGRVPKYKGQYVKEMYFKINETKYKNRVLDILVNTNWEKEVCNGTTGQFNLTQWQVYKYLKEQIPELE